MPLNNSKWKNTYGQQTPEMQNKDSFESHSIPSTQEYPYDFLLAKIFLRI